MLGSTQQQNVLGERTYEGVCELRFHEGGGGGEKRRQENSSPWKKTLSRLFSNSELRARLLHLEPHIYCTLIPGGSLTQYSFRIN